jgi:hypothetical protein
MKLPAVVVHSFSYAALAALMALAWPISAGAAQDSRIREEEAYALGVEAYIYGYPLVLMNVTQRVLTNVPRPTGARAPVNQFAHRESFPTPESKSVVSPNADTLYSVAWLDLSREPMILHVPDTKGRYYVMQLLDAWTNVFAAPGKRTTGTKEQNFAICGRGWKGVIPRGVTEIRSPTNMVWLLGRTQTNGPADFPAVHAIQSRYALRPLSAWNKSYTPPSNVPVAPGVDTKTPPVTQLEDMDADLFFKALAALMGPNPPPDADAAMRAKLQRIGIVPGGEFDLANLDPLVSKALRRAVQTARRRIAAAYAVGGDYENGWRMNRGLGRYGTDYIKRAVVASVALGANLPEDAIYPAAEVDSAGRKLNGAHRYLLHFDKDQIPPTNAFWSVTMYDPQHFFVENALHRYAIGDRDKLSFNADGSLDLLLQHELPSGKESNWLPAPKENFSLMLRIYWPKPEAISGSWKPPAVQRIE